MPADTEWIFVSLLLFCILPHISYFLCSDIFSFYCIILLEVYRRSAEVYSVEFVMCKSSTISLVEIQLAEIVYLIR